MVILWSAINKETMNQNASKKAVNISPLIEVDELLSLLDEPHLRFFDASNQPGAAMAYEQRHLAGAAFVSVDEQLAEIQANVALGGRHPLPSLNRFAVVLQQLGIDKNSHVVIYDDSHGANAAARFWWMLRSTGHARVQVLNGGLKAAIENNFPLSNQKLSYSATTEPYPCKPWMLPLKQMEDIKLNSPLAVAVIVDVRSNERFEGIHEPIDLVAGHIPGAVNIPFTENLDSKGLFHSADILRDKYLPLMKLQEANQITVHCGSGVTACHTLLAMDHAGFEIPALYVGSWSEWSRNNKPMATGKSQVKFL
jgi:thiosulfate/3-mercaptopyruvate sulfurtransferase